LTAGKPDVQALAANFFSQPIPLGWVKNPVCAAFLRSLHMQQTVLNRGPSYKAKVKEIFKKAGEGGPFKPNESERLALVGFNTALHTLLQEEEKENHIAQNDALEPEKRIDVLRETDGIIRPADEIVESAREMYTITVENIEILEQLIAQYHTICQGLGVDFVKGQNRSRG
jgi:hypothetical protein